MSTTPVILPIETPTLGDRSYLAHDGAVAVVVDPQRDIDRVLALAEESGVRITHVFETHIHNDYLTGGLALAEATGASDMTEEGATVGAVAGAGVGALVGLALVGSTLVLPGLGPVLVGGALAAGLTGAGIGAASGGLLGGMIGAGIPEAEAQDYASRLERGHILVSAQVPKAEVHRVRDILHESGAGAD